MRIRPSDLLALAEKLCDGTYPFEIDFWARRTVEKGWGFRRRRVDADVLYFVVEGGLDFSTNGISRTLESGRLLWIPRGLVHDLQPAVHPTSVLHFRIRWSPEAAPNPFSEALAMPLPRVLPHLTELDPRISGGSARLKARCLLPLVLFELARETREPGRPDHPGVHRALAWARRSPPVTWSNARMAKEAGMPSERFARAFRAQTGRSPRAWMVEERLAMSQVLLTESGESIRLVAARCGWDNPLLYSRLFRNAFGTSPREWRRRVG